MSLHSSVFLGPVLGISTAETGIINTSTLSCVGLTDAGPVSYVKSLSCSGAVTCTGLTDRGGATTVSSLNCSGPIACETVTSSGNLLAPQGSVSVVNCFASGTISTPSLTCGPVIATSINCSSIVDSGALSCAQLTVSGGISINTSNYIKPTLNQIGNIITSAVNSQSILELTATNTTRASYTPISSITIEAGVWLFTWNVYWMYDTLSPTNQGTISTCLSTNSVITVNSSGDIGKSMVSLSQPITAKNINAYSQVGTYVYSCTSTQTIYLTACSINNVAWCAFITGSNSAFSATRIA